MMSKTAERFWLWATTAAISSLRRVGVDLEGHADGVEAVAYVGVDAEDAVQVHVALDVRLDRAELDAAVLRHRGDAGGQAARERRKHDLDRGGAVVRGGEDAGWSASMLYGVLWLCSAPAPKKVSTVERLCTPPSHSQLARQVNWAAAGVSVRAPRMARIEATSTPLSAVVVVSGCSCQFLLGLGCDGEDSGRRPTGLRDAAGDSWGLPGDFPRKRATGGRKARDLLSARP